MKHEIRKCLFHTAGPTVLKPRVLPCRDKALKLDGRTLIMGILNITPDSFSDGGQYNELDTAVRHACQMVEQGADLIDVGGESTRPGATPVSMEKELSRVLPIVEALRREIDVPISVDTYKPEVARQVLRAGAHIINDIWGLQQDPEMAQVVAEHQATVICMHNRKDTAYQSLIPDIVEDLQRSLRIAEKAGIDHERIWLDPGIGFAKTIEDNFALMPQLSEIVALGYPVVLGTSRKSMIWKTLEVTPQEAVEGTAATVALGIAQGCQIIRVHDVAAMKKVVRLTDRMLMEKN